MDPGSLSGVIYPPVVIPCRNCVCPLMSSVTTLKWREHIGKESISEVLRASQLPFDDLLKHYGHGYLQIYTKRYELSPLLWVDFVGWHFPSNPDASTIYAVCSYQHNASEVLDAAFSVLATHLNEDAPSKTKTMLAHSKRCATSPAPTLSVFHTVFHTVCTPRRRLLWWIT